MTEPSTTAPAEPKPKALMPADVLFALVNELATRLQERNKPLLHRIVLVVGVDRATALLHQTLAIEAQGGQMTLDGTRRKTPGGIFITLARAQATPEERPRLRQSGHKPMRTTPAPAPPPAAQTPPAPEPSNQAPVQAPRAPANARSMPALTWAAAQQLVTQALQASGEAKTVKITLIGRPSKIVQQPTCVIVAMQGQAPPSLPKGLPAPPAHSAITWAVFIATKQWNGVKDTIASNPEDQLIVEGYPLLDPKSGSGVVLAQQCKSALQEKAQRAAKAQQG